MKAMTEEGLEVECDEQGVVWNAGSSKSKNLSSIRYGFYYGKKCT